MKQHSKVITGILIGSGMGILLCVLNYFRFQIPYLDTAINFLGSAPSLLGVRLGLPDSFEYFFVILYFSILGFMFSWLIASSFRIRGLLITLFLFFVIFLHREAMKQLNSDFNSLFQLFHSSMMNE